MPEPLNAGDNIFDHIEKPAVPDRKIENIHLGSPIVLIDSGEAPRGTVQTLKNEIHANTWGDNFDQCSLLLGTSGIRLGSCFNPLPRYEFASPSGIERRSLRSSSKRL